MALFYLIRHGEPDYEKVIIVGHGMAFRVLKYIENITSGEIVECRYER